MARLFSGCTHTCRCPLLLRLGSATCCRRGQLFFGIVPERKRLSSRSSYLCSNAGPAMNPSMRVLHAPCSSRGLTGRYLCITQTLQYVEEAADPVIRSSTLLSLPSLGQGCWISSRRCASMPAARVCGRSPGFMTSRHDGQRIGQQKGAWNTWECQ